MEWLILKLQFRNMINKLLYSILSVKKTSKKLIHLLWSSYHIITLSHNHIITLSLYHIITLWHYHIMTLSYNHIITLSHYHVITLSRYHIIILSYYHIFILCMKYKTILAYFDILGLLHNNLNKPNNKLHLPYCTFRSL